jgi:hypothetical protein
MVVENPYDCSTQREVFHCNSYQEGEEYIKTNYTDDQLKSTPVETLQTSNTYR